MQQQASHIDEQHQNCPQSTKLRFGKRPRVWNPTKHFSHITIIQFFDSDLAIYFHCSVIPLLPDLLVLSKQMTVCKKTIGQRQRTAKSRRNLDVECFELLPKGEHTGPPTSPANFNDPDRDPRKLYGPSNYSCDEISRLAAMHNSTG